MSPSSPRDVLLGKVPQVNYAGCSMEPASAGTVPPFWEGQHFSVSEALSQLSALGKGGIKSSAFFYIRANCRVFCSQSPWHPALLLRPHSSGNRGRGRYLIAATDC